MFILCKLILLPSLLILALTGFACTYKIQAEEECLTSIAMCYECDSRYDPNCADPFDFTTFIEVPIPSIPSNEKSNNFSNLDGQNIRQIPNQPLNLNINETILMRIPKKLPASAVCHGCCVKITSKTPTGVSFIKRTCTTNLQINFFMVDLVCMKESGDRGKMCFCETDYCNGKLSSHPSRSITLTLAIFTIVLMIMISNNQ